ncbi:hypothetical protein LWF15_05385 [Kineosporia rhizophila]|uniref:hypothetical protein n=1 Tax=Kineosporia TaxID=49184 RepID=UPI001E2DE4AF|nr:MULTISPECIES: hypothetical protein [Kineosporia]MCE0534935.1 hypothetical protein [Kineosporia rhizophila]GLY14784.1 hypothetical protein Kisp01_17990 [Kineosporia sp. NBRC 101677]
MSAEAVKPPASLVGQAVVCGIAVAATRFVPVPLLDDAIHLRATQVAVVRTLRAGGRSYPSRQVAALYEGADAGGVFHEAMKYVRSVPRRVILFPVRKYVKIFGAVKGVPTDVMKVVLLSRAVHRALAQGYLSDQTEEDRRKDEARLVRRAYDEALQGMDLRLLSAAIADGLSQGRKLTPAAVKFARNTFGKPEDEKVTDAELKPQGEVGESVERVEEALARPEIQVILERFDTEFDRELGKQKH